MQNVFTDHGVRVVSQNELQHNGVCPFCGKQKFYYEPKRLLWDCKVCGRKGGPIDFLQQAYDALYDDGAALDDLAAMKSIPPDCLAAIGTKGMRGGVYCIPEYIGSELQSLSSATRYITAIKGARATTGLKHGLFKMTNDPMTKTAWVAEGWSDTAAVVAITGGTESVYGMPGAGVLPLNCLEIFRSRDVIFLGDNDKAGRNGDRIIKQRLDSIADSIKFLHWPATARAKMDTRDLYVGFGDAARGIITRRLQDTPREEVDADHANTLPADEAAIVEVAVKRTTTGTPISRNKVVEEFQKWMIIDPRVLDVTFGVCYANMMGKGEDPLWMFLVGPPSTGKSELLLALDGAPIIEPVSTLTRAGLISGQNTGQGDPSLLNKLKNRILCIKDFTSIMGMNQTERDEIIGILRDAYDGDFKKVFGSAVTRSYKDHRFGIIAGVTGAIDGLSASGGLLGERFIRFNVYNPGAEHELTQKAMRNTGKKAEMRVALRLASKNALARRVDSTHLPTITDDQYNYIQDLATIVKILRGSVARDRYSGMILHDPVKEGTARFSIQLCRMGQGIAVFREEKDLSEEIIDTLRCITRDTIPSRVAAVVKALYFRPEMSPTNIAKYCGYPNATVSRVLEDLQMLEGVKRGAGVYEVKWTITNTLLQAIQKTNFFQEEKIFKEQIKGDTNDLHQSKPHSGPRRFKGQHNSGN